MGKINYSFLTKPLPGQKYCGDIAWIREFDNQLFFCLIDVAGHGYEAEIYAEECCKILESHYKENLLQILNYLNEYLLSRRPIVIGATVIDLDTGLIHNVSVGNISTRIIGKQSYRFYSPTGMLGQGPIKPKIQEYLLNDRDLILMYSDGVTDHFEKANYPEILTDSIDIIPNRIIEQFSKTTDDCGCIAVRYFE